MNLEKKPLITDNYSADPSAKVFGGRLYIYPSHDRDIEMVSNDNGDQYDMNDYHAYRMDSTGAYPADLGVILRLEDVPWASAQLWAPDCAEKGGKYYFYFPARDKAGIFRIGVAVADNPGGPFKARPEPMKGSYSIDPCVFADDDGESYLAFGGIWGGQLDKWAWGSFDPEGEEPAGNVPALCPRIARLAGDMLEFAHAPRELQVIGPDGRPLRADDKDNRYFEDPWIHKRAGKYYFSWSTGDTHRLCHAIADDPYGPYVFQGMILPPVLGWTSHHSIVEFEGAWWLFYHDCELSKGINHKRNVKFQRLDYDGSGRIIPMKP